MNHKGTMASSSLFLKLFLSCILTASIDAATITRTTSRNLATKFDLSNPNSAERFFATSNINANYDASSDLVWTAETPLAVGCGVSILVAEEISENNNSSNSTGINYQYLWKHVFSSTMDASVPTTSHTVSLQLDESTLSSLANIDTASPLSSSNNNNSSKVAFRMFAFLPYGKGIFLSHTYAIDLPNNPQSSTMLNMYALDFNTGYSGKTPTYPAPSFMFGADFMGLEPTAFAQGPCYESIDLMAGDSNVIVVGGGNSNEGACVCEVEDQGFKRRTANRRRQLQESDFVCDENSSPLVNYTLSEGMVAFHLDLESKDVESVAASFYYGLDPSPGIDGGVIDYSYDAFYDTDGFNDNVNVTEIHGIVRAEEVTSNPSAFASLSQLPSTEGNESQSSLVVGGVWIDSQFVVKYSRETRIPMSDVVKFLPEVTDTSSDTSDGSNSIVRESSMCPTGSMRNIALLSQGAFVLDVSSNYSSAYTAMNAIDGDSSTEWSTAQDGNDAFITIQLPFPSNVVYVDFHTRTMGSSAQIYEYQVEAGNKLDDLAVVAPTCEVPDATKSYECDLDLSDANDETSGGVRNVTMVTFRVVNSSGGNTGAIDVGVFGCSVADEDLNAMLNGETDAESNLNGGVASEQTNATKTTTNAPASDSIQKTPSSHGAEIRISFVFNVVYLFVTYFAVMGFCC
eukprot:CCRYP_010862-RA/>CCRYP_010862-RA protein AED:0.22 eAED:0.22 QI:219/1/0.5/1/1/1/2/0/683